MPDYPITVQGPNVTASDPDVKRLVFDYLAERQGPGVDLIAVERMLFEHGHNPHAAKILLREWSKAGALTKQSTTGTSVTYYRLRVAG